MRVRDYPRYCQDMFAAHVTLRRLGFDFSEMSVRVDEAVVGEKVVMDRCFLLELRAQEKNFVVAVAELKESVSTEAALGDWKNFAGSCQSTSVEELLKICRNFGGYMASNVFIISLQNKGFSVQHPALLEGNDHFARIVSELSDAYC